MSIQQKTPSQQHKLSLLQLIIMIFALTSGGPFGIETAVQSGGVLLTLIGLVLVPLFYSLPQSLMCCELGSMMPSHHGKIVWAFRGFKNDGHFGNFLGFYNAVGSTLGMAKDIPLYIVVMLFYFQQFVALHVAQFHMDWYQEYAFKFFCVLIGALLNMRNIQSVGNTTSLFMLFVFVPFIVGFLFVLPQLTWSEMTATTPYNNASGTGGSYQLGLWLSTLLWCHTGWDSVGCLTADISFSKKKLLGAFVCAMFLDLVFYAIPVVGALSQTCDHNCWADGYLYVAYNNISPWIGYFVLIAGFVANFGVYVSEMSVQARALWALCQPFVILKDGKMFVITDEGVLYDDDMNVVSNEMQRTRIMKHGEKIRIGMMPSWLCGTLDESSGAPNRAVLFQSVFCCAMFLFDFSFLLQATVLINCITWCIELCSFLRLRYSEPADELRPYKVPGGLFVAWLITIDKMVVVALLLVLVLWDNPQYAWITIGSFVLTLLWYIIYLWNIRQRSLRNALRYDLATRAVSKHVAIDIDEKDALHAGMQRKPTDYGSIADANY